MKKTEKKKETEMSHDVILKVLKKEKWWQTTKYEIYKAIKTIDLIRHEDITVPKGFVTDGATIPRALIPIGIFNLMISKILFFIGLDFWFSVFYIVGMGCILAPYVFPKVGKYILPAVIHDYLLSEASHMGEVMAAHKTFLKIMECEGVAGWRRYPMFTAVFLATPYFYLTDYKKRWASKEK